MKEMYKSLDLEIIAFEAEDVIRASLGGGDGDGYGDGEEFPDG